MDGVGRATQEAKAEGWGEGIKSQCDSSVTTLFESTWFRRCPKYYRPTVLGNAREMGPMGGENNHPGEMQASEITACRSQDNRPERTA